jgi:hypothetical protein
MTQDTTGGGLERGRRERDAALVALEARRAALIVRGERAMLVALLRDGRATADDVRAELGELPGGADPRWLGAVPRRLSAAAICEHAGYTHTARPVGHARPIALWRLADRDAALRRLAELTADTPVPMVSLPAPTAQRLLWEAAP